MNFRNQTSFNAHDSRQVVSETGRVAVALGVKRRCELVLNTLIRLWGGNSVDVTTHLKSRFNDSYSQGDVKTAIDKLRSGGLVFRRGRGRAAKFYPSRDALAKWRALPKNSV
jgi:hypothetical protein